MTATSAVYTYRPREERKTAVNLARAKVRSALRNRRSDRYRRFHGMSFNGSRRRFGRS